MVKELKEQPPAVIINSAQHQVHLIFSTTFPFSKQIISLFDVYLYQFQSPTEIMLIHSHSWLLTALAGRERAGLRI